MGEVELKQGWQPMETAPDGEDVLLCVPRYGVTHKYAFIEMAVGYNSNGKWYSDASEEPQYELNTPTHWMPLPEPPAKP
jgi:hypothetical protein